MPAKPRAPDRLTNEVPTLLVMMIMVLRKLTVRPLAIRQPAVVQQLQQSIPHIGVGLLDFNQRARRYTAGGGPVPSADRPARSRCNQGARRRDG